MAPEVRKCLQEIKEILEELVSSGPSECFRCTAAQEL